MIYVYSYMILFTVLTIIFLYDIKGFWFELEKFRVTGLEQDGIYNETSLIDFENARKWIIALISNPLISFTFISWCFVISFVLSIQLVVVFIFILIYLIRLFTYVKYVEVWDFFIPSRHYEFGKSVEWGDLLALIFVRNPRFCAFIFIYSTYKFFKKREITFDYKSTIKRLLISVFIGYGILTLDLARIFTLASINLNLKTLIQLPSIFIFSFKTRENSVLNISYKLRIYKDDGKIVFNPPKEIIETGYKSLSVVGVKSVGAKGRLITHPALVGFVKDDEHGSRVALQLTKKPIENMNGFRLKRDHPEYEESFVNTNTIQLSSNIINNYNSNVLMEHNLRSRHALEMLYMRVSASWVIDRGIRIEGTVNHFIRDVTMVQGYQKAMSLLEKVSDPLLEPRIQLILEACNDNFYDLPATDRNEIVKIYSIKKNDVVNLFKNNQEEYEIYIANKLKIKSIVDLIIGE